MSHVIEAVLPNSATTSNGHWVTLVSAKATDKKQTVVIGAVDDDGDYWD